MLNNPNSHRVAKPLLHWSQPVIRVRTTYNKTVYVQTVEWLSNCEHLREMQANGWPRRFLIARRKIIEAVGEPRSKHPNRGVDI